jgi:hypothetical protein
VAVRLLNSTGTQLATTTTNANGEYKFNSASILGLTANTSGFRIVSITTQAGLSGLSLTALDAPAKGQDNTQNDSDSVATLNGADAQITFNTGLTGASNNSYDFSFGGACGSLGDIVWNDLNRNDQQDAGAPGVVVHLMDASNNVLLRTATNSSGLYSFQSVVPGTYKLDFTKPAAYNFTIADAGSDVSDSDANAGTGHTGLINLAAGENNLTVNAGLVAAAPLQSNPAPGHGADSVVHLVAGREQPDAGCRCVTREAADSGDSVGGLR